MIAVETKNLSKNYGKTRALADLNLNIRQGEIYALLGPNGAGKTTTIKILTTIQKSSFGDAVILDKSIDNRNDIKDIRSMIAVMPQGNALDPFLSVWDNLRFYARLQKIKNGSWEGQARKYLAKLDLEKKKSSPVMALSGGQFRRVQCCRVLLADKRLIFLDEPTLGIDVSGKIKVWDLIKEYQAKTGCSILLSTNDMTEAEYLGDRIGFLFNGSLVDEGSVNELKDRAFMGILQIRYAEDIDSIFPEGRKYKIEKKDHRTVLFYLDQPDRDLRSVIEYAGQLGAIIDIEVRKPSLTDLFKKKYMGKE